jgi:hypothetical protein
MNGRIKLFAAAALGLVLTTGTLAGVSAKTLTTATVAHQTHVAKPHKPKLATKSHHMHVAHIGNAHKARAARHQADHHVSKVSHRIERSKQAGAAASLRGRHAMNHRPATKPTSVIR